MKRIKLLGVLACLISLNSFGQNTVCFSIVPNPNASDLALSVFTKYVDVFGCGIYAEASVSDEKVLHAAAIWAELIDNDEDGVVDDQLLITELQNSAAIMPIFQADGNAAMNTFFNNYTGNGVSAVLWQTEIDPSQPGHWGDDATIEEIIHTINSVGHAAIYPNAFDFSPNSSLLTTAMDFARGGQFLTIPVPYPASAWYHYDDNTCDYGCMAIEYIYWMLVSNMGILNDVPTCSGIANEWEPCSQVLLQSTDVLGYNLITNPMYKLPQNAPDGNYCPASIGLNEEKLETKFNMYPNPSAGMIHFEFNDNNKSGSIVILNVFGRVNVEEMVYDKSIQIDISALPSGVYLVKCGTQSTKLVVL